MVASTRSRCRDRCRATTARWRCAGRSMDAASCCARCGRWRHCFPMGSWYRCSLAACSRPMYGRCIQYGSSARRSCAWQWSFWCSGFSPGRHVGASELNAGASGFEPMRHARPWSQSHSAILNPFAGRTSTFTASEGLQRVETASWSGREVVADAALTALWTSYGGSTAYRGRSGQCALPGRTTAGCQKP